MKGCSGPSVNAALLKTSFWNWSRYFVPQGDKKAGSNLRLINRLLLDLSKSHMPFKCIKKENNLIILLTCFNRILFTFPEDPGFHLSLSKGIQNFLHAYFPPCLYSTSFNMVFSLNVRFFSSSSSAPLLCLMKDFFFFSFVLTFFHFWTIQLILMVCFSFVLFVFNFFWEFVLFEQIFFDTLERYVLQLLQKSLNDPKGMISNIFPLFVCIIVILII